MSSMCNSSSRYGTEDALKVTKQWLCKLDSAGKIKLTTARSSESAKALDEETSKLSPIAAAVRNSGSSISLVGVG